MLGYASLEYRLPLGRTGRWALPLRFDTGYLPKNGPFVRVGPAVAVPIGKTTDIIVSLFVNIGSKIIELAFEVTILPYGFHAYTVSLLISLALFFGISLLSKPPRLDPDVEALMDI